ncbi:MULTISPECIES: DNA/RNA non-specific endonuclease [Ralstonia]|uniref:DNA/RNA non-specific endonuclease n=2 Tax=Pseudomonadota TaxID=1224 RepID=UPI0015F9F497|nr:MULTISPECIES: DNA/RNA non-specific endonuclease [Ralstonia]NOZ16598.1 DNA/RNA non-specific endonuclease [Betaproteobacteria bacterium]MBT2179589.1 DNA/RNA non-specific endonuclease [Ralstonia pickettii]MBX3774844.1 DNA/RNA non-specific endonuclease [Ralstonia pickettii]MBX3813801.1 DNA/RNA non-specific endonuclease [Ralstonia pickettii]MBX3819685.1 DNA/RNA non-specific endonuclease [Ralstonia insidiosa]
MNFNNIRRSLRFALALLAAVALGGTLTPGLARQHHHQLSLTDIFGAPALSQDCESNFLQGQAPQVTNPKLAAQTRELCNPGYAVLHSGITRTPLWSAEHLTQPRIRASINLSREDSFRSDDRLPMAERAELDDYARSGWDRGHMSPNKDAPDRTSQSATFLLSNMIPQAPKHNQHLWESIERATRQLALNGHDVYVVTGPAFLGSQLRRTGHVAIPSHVWKAVYVADTGEAAVWWTENTNESGYDLISLDELARRTSIAPFPAASAASRVMVARLPKPRLRHSSNNF